MSRQSFLIRPLEAVYFGPPQSFNAGEAHHGGSDFPPSGYAFQGMVRSQLLRAATPKLNLDDNRRAARYERAALVGDSESLPNSWQITGPLPARVITASGNHGESHRLEPWTATPRFLLGPAESPCRARLINQDADAHPAMTDLGQAARLLGRPDRPDAKPLGGWLSPGNLRYALTAGHPAGRPWESKGYTPHRPPFAHQEHRPGLALDGDTARHGMLYFLNTLRMHDPDSVAGFYGSLTGDWDERIPADALTATLGAAGRKERPAAFEPAPPLDTDFQYLLDGEHLPAEVRPNDCFWLVTLTPTALDNPADPLPHGVEGARVEALGMLSGPPSTIGGYRYADAATRPNRPYLPAGTCWLFRLHASDPKHGANALRRLNNAHPLGDPKEAAFGFGHTLVGLGYHADEEHA